MKIMWILLKKPNAVYGAALGFLYIGMFQYKLIKKGGRAAEFDLGLLCAKKDLMANDVVYK